MSLTDENKISYQNAARDVLISLVGKQQAEYFSFIILSTIRSREKSSHRTIQLSVSRRVMRIELLWRCLNIRKFPFRGSPKMLSVAGGAFSGCVWCLWVQKFVKVDDVNANWINRVEFQIFNVSLIPTFGILFESILVGDSESAEIVMVLFQVLTNLTILATGFLIKDLTAKNFVIIGSSLTFAGLLLTAAVTNATQLIVTFSTMISIGLGLLNPAAFVAVLACFTSKRVYAISFGFAALGLGQMIMPLIVQQCLANYGLQATLFIVSGLSIFGIIGGHLLVPIKWKPCPQNDHESQPLLIKMSLNQSSIIKNIVRATDLDLLWNHKYITIIFGLSVVFASSTILNVILPHYLQVCKKKHV